MLPVIVVTGASKGLGKVIYDRLKSSGLYQVIGTSRGLTTTLMPLEITDPLSINAFVDQVIATYGQVDVLINNIGSNIIGSTVGTSTDELRYQLDTNFMGHVNLSKRFMIPMLERNNGKIINISSMGGLVPLPLNSAYAASKAALEAYMSSMYYELMDKDIHVSMIEPIALKVTGEATTLKRAENELTQYKGQQTMVYHTLTTDVKPWVTRARVAKVTLHVIKKQKPKFRYVVGFPGKALLFLKVFLPHRWFARLLALWYN